MDCLTLLNPSSILKTSILYIYRTRRGRSQFYIFDGSKIEEVTGLIDACLKTSEGLNFTTMKSFWDRVPDNLEDAMKYAIAPRFC